MRFDRMACLESKPIALSDHGQDQNRLGHCKARPNANPLTRSEREIAEPWRFGRKSIRIETMRIAPERRLAMQELGRNQTIAPAGIRCPRIKSGAIGSRAIVCAGG